MVLLVDTACEVLRFGNVGERGTADERVRRTGVA